METNLTLNPSSYAGTLNEGSVLGTLTTNGQAVNVKVTIRARRWDSSIRELNKPLGVFVWETYEPATPDVKWGESDEERAAHDKAWKAWRKQVNAVQAPVVEATLRALGVVTTETPRWNRKAFCTCGCSPAWQAKTARRDYRQLPVDGSFVTESQWTFEAAVKAATGKRVEVSPRMDVHVEVLPGPVAQG